MLLWEESNKKRNEEGKYNIRNVIVDSDHGILDYEIYKILETNFLYDLFVFHSVNMIVSSP